VKKIVETGVVMLLLAAVMIGCAGTPEPEPEKQTMPEPTIRRPEVLDHKNYKWGTPVPDWVAMELDQLEALDEFEDYYVFKYESPRAKDLQGAELWTRNFTASSSIAQTVQNRVETRFAGAAAGDLDMVETYMEQVVASFSDSQFSGYRAARDYWVKMRYFDGAEPEDAYTYVVLYTIPRDTLDRMVQDALDAAAGDAETEEEQTVRERVKEAFERGL
jgi:hypothetical protein